MVIRRMHKPLEGGRLAIDRAGLIVCSGLAGTTLVLLLAALRLVL